MKKNHYYDADNGGGRRYELVKSALAGGCPEMLMKIERIINYIDTGDDSHLKGEEEYQARENENLSQKLQELKAENERLMQELNEAKKIEKEISAEISEITRKVRKNINDNHLALDEYFGTSVGDGVTGLSATVIKNAIEGFSSVYVEIEGTVHRVTSVYKHGTKAILEVSENGYPLKDGGNGLDQREKLKHTINKVYHFGRLGQIKWF